jgi:hypothetical protein
MDFIFGANSLKPNTVKKERNTNQRNIVQSPDRIVSKVSCVYKTLPRKVNKEEDPNVNMPINNIIKVAKPAIIKIIQKTRKF